LIFLPVALLWKKEVSEKREWAFRIQWTGRLVRRAEMLLLITWGMSLIAQWFDKS
jgi:hypothetical protein